MTAAPVEFVSSCVRAGSVSFEEVSLFTVTSIELDSGSVRREAVVLEVSISGDTMVSALAVVEFVSSCVNTGTVVFVDASLATSVSSELISSSSTVSTGSIVVELLCSTAVPRLVSIGVGVASTIVSAGVTVDVGSVVLSCRLKTTGHDIVGAGRGGGSADQESE